MIVRRPRWVHCHVAVILLLFPVLVFWLLPDCSGAAAGEISDEEVIDNDCDNIAENGSHSLDGLVFNTFVQCGELEDKLIWTYGV